ncbi:conserved membrane hypothetical protein [Burkholderia diffusa]|uniref:hypothetical protein n=1 Tax=Burkholderia diffusa TaxID=488732 RepID=UPI001CB51C91|nr:hypothetical protein [Burkholderia diffusa]CAG9265740.1 conserved membrane hypothetical protein [Burkholderia diffusa]
MTFRWNPQFSSEWEAPKPPPVWLFLILYLIVEGFALAMVVPDLPRVGPIPWDRFIHDAVVLPFFGWIGLSCFAWLLGYDLPARHAAAHNIARWHEITGWQRQSRAGVAVLDSVILTPEPDLAERMLKLEGSPPENPGKVMRLDSVDGADSVSRERAMLEKLLAPLAARLTLAARSDSFDIVIQCERPESTLTVQAAWEQLHLPRRPRIRALNNEDEPGFADAWFEQDRQMHYGAYTGGKMPKFRLVLAWHLNPTDADTAPESSEAAVALLLGSSALMQEKPDTKRQAWLLRQISRDADQADQLLALLVKAEQVPAATIRHFWHSRLKGLAQHATMGAVKESDLKVEEHALDSAIGPQAPVARWVLQAMAAKMAQFGQGAQLIALPHEQRGIALNVVAKEPARVAVPWKEEYEYAPIVGPELGVLASIWMVLMLLLPKGWSTANTVISCVIAVAIVVLFVLRHVRFVMPTADAILDFVASWLG